MKKINLLIIFYSSLIYSQSQYIPYISPGVGMEFNKKGTAIVLKVSIGINSSYSDIPYFANITIGKHIQRQNVKYVNYTYCEIEAGPVLTNPVPIVMGAGLGIANQKYYKQNHFCSKGSLFIGSLLFARADYVKMNENDTLLSSYGLMCVLPISPVTMFILTHKSG